MRDKILEKFENLKRNNEKMKTIENMEPLIEALDILMNDVYSQYAPLENKNAIPHEKDEIFLVNESMDIDRAVGVIEVGLDHLSMEYINEKNGAYSYVALGDKGSIIAHLCDDDENIIDVTEKGFVWNDEYYPFTSNNLLEKASMIKTVMATRSFSPNAQLNENEYGKIH